MKSVFKTLGIIVMTMVIGLMVIGCGGLGNLDNKTNGDNTDNGKTPGGQNYDAQKSITITGISSEFRDNWYMYVMDTNFDDEIAMDEALVGTTSSITFNLVSTDDPELETPWTGQGNHYLGLYINDKMYFYTNGKEFDNDILEDAMIAFSQEDLKAYREAMKQLMVLYNITNMNSIPFSKFKEFTVGSEAPDNSTLTGTWEDEAGMQTIIFSSNRWEARITDEGIDSLLEESPEMTEEFLEASFVKGTYEIEGETVTLIITEFEGYYEYDGDILTGDIMTGTYDETSAELYFPDMGTLTKK